MTGRRGQIAICLALVLVAICVLMLMNVGIFLSVRAKNRAMNAGDAAALAVAKFQGELLNDVGRLNVEHLKAALENDEEKCAEIMERQLRISFLEPLRGIEIGNEIARKNGAATLVDAKKDAWKKLMKAHVADIRSLYVSNPDLYPEPWDGAWQEFAAALEVQLGPDFCAWPENAEFADLRESFPLAVQDFYFAIAGKAWCWFRFNGPWMFERDSDHMPKPDFSSPLSCVNSEIYPLHLKFESLPPVLDGEWVEIVKRVADCTEEDIARSYLVTNASQRWAFYDYRWNRWSTYDGIAFNSNEFPLVGDVKPEYDVLGCAAVCRTVSGALDLFADDNRGRAVEWTAGAKPFGTVEDTEGNVSVVTALRRFVVPSFEATRLVPVDSVGGRDLHTADAEWMAHVKYHIPSSAQVSPVRAAGCWYCQQLFRWDNPSFRQEGRNWLNYHASDCIRPTGSGNYRGGTAHGH